MSGNIVVSPFNPVQQSGVRAKNPPDTVIAFRAPTTKDIWFPATLWVYVNTAAYICVGQSSQTAANWLTLGAFPAGGIVTINTISADGMGDFTIDGTAGQITVTGGTNKITLSIPDDFSIGSDGGASAGEILVGSGGLVIDGAASADISIGESCTSGSMVVGAQGSSDTTLQSGSGGFNLASHDGALTITSGTGAIGLSSDATNTTIGIGNGAGAKLLTIGSLTGASSMALQVGTGNFTLNGVAGSTYTVGASTTTGTMTIGGTAQTGTMTLGSSSGTNIVAIGAGTGATTVNIAGGAGSAKAVNIATGAVANVVVMGSASGAASVSLLSGTGGISLAAANGAVAITSGTGAMSISADAAATTLSIGTGAAVKAVTLGSTNTTSALTLQSGSGGITMTGIITSANSLTLNGAATQLKVHGGAVTDFIGTAVLVAGTVTVANTNIAATDRILYGRSTTGGTEGHLSYTISAATSFTFNSSEAGDTSTIAYMIVRQTA